MFFFFSKILYFLITPVFWILMLLIFSFILKKAQLKKKLLLAGIILYIIFTNNFIFNIVAVPWEVNSKNAAEINRKYEFGIVLGGMVSQNLKTKKIQFSPSIDRLMQAIVLYKQGKIKKILISGGSGLLLNQDVKEAFLLKDICIKLGIYETDIITEPNSKNTHENALFTKNITGIDTVMLLITSAYHMRRAAACFKHEGFKFDILTTDPLDQAIMGPDDYFMPKAEPLVKWSFIIKEWIGFVAYKVAGYI
jgi:uncharacterized SAM-binding protein YcdF (DUF218 family)